MAGTIYGECEDLPNLVVGVGLVEVTENASGGVDINVDPPVFSADSTMTITGSWPLYSFSANPQSSGGALTLNSGAGIEVIGGPTNYTFNLKPTGIAAGDYGPITFNTFGQATAVGPILSTLTAQNGIESTTDIGTGAVVVAGVDATTLDKGVVALYNTVGTTPYPEDVAATPNAVLEIVNATLASMGGVGDARTYTLIQPINPVSDPANFGNSTLLATTGVVSIPSGESRAIWLEVELTAAINCYAFVVPQNLQISVAEGVTTNTTRHIAVGSISGPFDGPLQVRVFNPAAPTVPTGAVAATITLLVS